MITIIVTIMADGMRMTMCSVSVVRMCGWVDGHMCRNSEIDVPELVQNKGIALKDQVNWHGQLQLITKKEYAKFDIYYRLRRSEEAEREREIWSEETERERGGLIKRARETG